MISVYLLSVLLGFLNLSESVKPDLASSSVDWPGVFSRINERNAAVFRLKNKRHLDLPQGPSSYHQQGIQRMEKGGWAVSGSGQDRGYLYFTKSNGTIHTIFTIPDDLSLAGQDALLKYNHPGGFQILGNILAVGLENTDQRDKSYARVVLVDVSNPRHPKHLNHLDIVRPAENNKVMTAGAVAIAELSDAYLIIVGNWDSKRLDFYQTSSKDLASRSTTMSPCLGSWTADSDFNSYQNINVYGNSLEELYVIGLYSLNRQDDWADLLSIDCSDWKNIKVTLKSKKQFIPVGEAPRFVHGAGTCYDVSGKQLFLFSVEAHMNNQEIQCNRWGGAEPRK